MAEAPELGGGVRPWSFYPGFSHSAPAQARPCLGSGVGPEPRSPVLSSSAPAWDLRVQGRAPRIALQGTWLEEKKEPRKIRI